MRDHCMKAAVEAPRAVVSKLISWAKELRSCITVLSVTEGYSWAAEWHVIVIFHNCASHTAFYCSGRLSSSPVPWAVYSCSVPEVFMWSKSLCAETGGTWSTSLKGLAEWGWDILAVLWWAACKLSWTCWSSMAGEGRIILTCLCVYVFQCSLASLSPANCCAWNGKWALIHFFRV